MPLTSEDGTLVWPM